MKVLFVNFLIFSSIFYATKTVGQAPNLGAATNFVLFTTTGDVTNTAVTNITGDIGTNTGAITGFGAPSIVNGMLHTQDGATAQAATDLQTAYQQLFNTTTTVAGHAPAFGNETVTDGVYGITGAGSVGGNLTLDAGGNPNAVFIFKFGGAITMGAGAAIILANGALAGNVFWVAEGAISIAANVIVKGTLIAHQGANSLGSGSSLEGRLLSTAGAISINFDSIVKPTSGGYVAVPIELLLFTGVCTGSTTELKWTTATEINNKYFSIERSINFLDWKFITNIAGAFNSVTTHNYSYIDSLPIKGDYYYRLKQTDVNGSFKYGPIINIQNCGNNQGIFLKIYPNPFVGKFKILFKGDINDIELTQVFDILGKKVIEENGFCADLDLRNAPSGFYFLKLLGKKNVFSHEIIIKKN